jgi:fibronectin-binding autotransporter adhesin
MTKKSLTAKLPVTIRKSISSWNLPPAMKLRYSNPFAAIVAAALISTSSSQAQTRTWDGGGGNDNWNTTGNWDNNALPENTADVIFGTGFGSGTSIDLIATRTVNSFTIDTTTAFSITGGNDLILTAGLLTRNDVAGTEGDHSFTANIVLGANGVFDINGDGTTTIIGAIEDGANTFSLTKSGNGVLILAGAADSYGGDTIVSGGILRLGTDNQIANGALFGNLVVNLGGTFDLAGFSDTINGLSGDGIVDKSTASAETLTLGGGDATASFTGTIQNTLGTIAVTKTGTGTQTLAGNNTYSGLTTVSGNGVLNIQHANALGSTAAGTTIASGSALQIQGGIVTAAEALAIDGTGISNNGALRNISGNNTYSGAITINSATRINSDSGLLTLDVASGNAITGTNDDLTFGGAGDITVADAIATTGGDLTKDGIGKLTLTAANTYTGLTTVSAGTLEYGIDNALSSGGITVSGGILDIKTFNDTVGTVTLSGGGSINGTTGVLTGTSYAMQDGSAFAILGGAGALTKTTAGTVTLFGVNTYTGATIINAGTLSVGTIGDGGVAGNMGAATITAANLTLGGGTLQYTGATDSTNRNFVLTGGTSSTIEVVNAGTELTMSGASTNTTGALAKTGAGKLILTGTNLYTGLTTVSAGTLEYGVTNALSSGAVTVNGGILDIKTFNDTVGTVTLSGGGSITGTTGVLTGTSYAMQDGSASAILGGTGALTKTTAGTVTLSGANTYTGATNIDAGTLNIRNSAALGATSGNTTIDNGATLELQGGITVGAGETLSLRGAGVGGNGALRNISGDNIWSDDITLTNNTQVHRINSDAGTLTINGGISEDGTANNKDLTFGGAGDITVAGVITGTAGDMRLFKDGSGNLNLTNANSYSGLTTISDGTLFANNASGSATGTGAVAVSSGGTLGGSGFIAPTGSDGINVSGVLAPGGSVNTTGNLTLDLGGTTGTVAMSSGSGFEFLLGSAGLSFAAVGTSDLLTIAAAAANDFSFSGNDVDFLNSGAIGYYKLFDTSSDNADTWTGLTFDPVTGVVGSGLTYNNLAGGLTGTFIVGTATNGGTTGDIYFQVVPEPSGILLGGPAALLLLARRRRKG